MEGVIDVGGGAMRNNGDETRVVRSEGETKARRGGETRATRSGDEKWATMSGDESDEERRRDV
jgi:hypothetical protein